MDTFKSFKSKLYQANEQSFEHIAFEIFRYQSTHNPIYKSFIDNLNLDIQKISTVEAIPFLPISFFKSHTLVTGQWQANVIFTSSGTSQSTTSSHLIYDLQFYLNHSRLCFEFFFGPLREYHFLALLPSYLERSGSSLIAMIDHFIKYSGSSRSGFYLNATEKLLSDLEHLRKDKRKTILWGVSFALLDLAERYNVDLSHCIIFETGGMKGRRKEITRAELHDVLKKRLNVEVIHAEYGMTELLSQAYTRGNFQFSPPPWMAVVGREITDPFNKGLLNETSGINVIDLANWHSISFIETDDLGKVYRDGSFEILGRIDNSDVRGCNLLVE